MRLMAILACLVMATGCSGFINKQAAASTYGILVKSNEAAQRQSDIQLARDAMPSGLLQLETFALAYPEHVGFKKLHAEAYCQYGVAFVFDDWEDATLAGRTADAQKLAERLGPLLARCVDLNLALLPRAWRDAREKSRDAFAALVNAARREQVPALLWIATADSVTIALAPMQNFARLPGVEAMLAKCAQLSPGFHNADAELLLATLVAGRSAVFGGDDAHTQFERARALAGEGALIVDVMFARGTAVARKDRALFTSTLERVLATDVTRWPERRLSNELARQKARRYLAAVATLIP